MEQAPVREELAHHARVLHRGDEPQPAGGQVGATATISTTHHTAHVTGSDCVAHTEMSVTTTTTIGSATILIGEDQSVTFFVAAGTLNVNTNTHTEFFVCDPAPAIPCSRRWG